MKFTFSDKNNGLTPVRPEHFENLRTFHWNGSPLFDGYSMCWRGESLPQLGGESFTVSLRFLPLTFSAHGDGLVSHYAGAENAGFQLLLKKGGILTVRLGTGRMTIDLDSCNAHALPGVWNIVTVVFRGNEGWCDLYVNGVFSNRRQFSRHESLRLPRAPWYLGKRVDGVRFTEETLPFGCFYGYMDWVSFDNFAIRGKEVLDLHKSFTGAYEEEAVRLGMPDRRAYRKDRHRPAYHMIPPGKWMNEPHGPMFYGGWYHIFYQANPHAPIWDHLSWGHLVSRDMLHWLDAPLALTPEGGTVAPDGIWSGSSLVDKEGKARIYFTAGNDHAFPNQAVALATPETDDDGKLLRWKQHPVPIQTQDIGWMGEYRDPFVWLENDTYFMLVGTGDEDFGGGNAALYSSPDGMDWESHGMLVDYDFSIDPIVGHVWELPVLLPLKDETGTVVCHILLLCACRVENDVVETPYFLGRWDPEKKTFTKLHDQARLVDLGRGTFTGPSGFVTPDGRSVLFTIAQGRRGFRAEQQAGWAHNGGMPVELFWKNGGLGVRPIREAESLKKALLIDAHGPCNDQLRAHPGDRLCLELTAEGDTASVSLCGKLTVRYDRNKRRLEVLDADGKFIGRYRGAADQVSIGDGPIRFVCLLDHSMLEIYLNETKSVTLRNYFPEERFFRVEGDVRHVKLWEMESAYRED